MEPTVIKTTPAFLEKVWREWNKRNTRSNYYITSFKSVSRSSSTVIRFENWLWERGAQVKQENHRRYIEFVDEEKAVMFGLEFL